MFDFLKFVFCLQKCSDLFPTLRSLHCGHFTHPQIEKLTLVSMRLGDEASEQCARGVFTMTKLRALTLDRVTLDDWFFSVMAEDSISITGRFHFTLSRIQYVSNSCIRLAMWGIDSGCWLGWRIIETKQSYEDYQIIMKKKKLVT